MTVARQTRQRRTIREVVERAGRPLSTGEILAGARQTIPSLAMATVYRSIRALIDEGWLAAVDVPGRSPLYERSGKGHHHHFACSHCRRVYELDGCTGEVRGEVPAGFVATGHDVTIHGACPSCSAASAAPATSKTSERLAKSFPLRPGARGGL
jgi:Fur family ferric uptake transcriptional regulator